MSTIGDRVRTFSNCSGWPSRSRWCPVWACSSTTRLSELLPWTLTMLSDLGNKENTMNKDLLSITVNSHFCTMISYRHDSDPPDQRSCHRFQKDPCRLHWSEPSLCKLSVGTAENVWEFRSTCIYTVRAKLDTLDFKRLKFESRQSFPNVPKNRGVKNITTR